MKFQHVKIVPAAGKFQILTARLNAPIGTRLERGVPIPNVKHKEIETIEEAQQSAIKLDKYLGEHVFNYKAK